MLIIDGAIQLLPRALTVDTVETKLDPNGPPKNAVAVNFLTESGQVSVVLPPDNIQALVDGLLKAKQSAESNLYIPESDDEVKDAVKVSEILEGKK